MNVKFPNNILENGRNVMDMNTGSNFFPTYRNPLPAEHNISQSHIYPPLSNSCDDINDSRNKMPMKFNRGIHQSYKTSNTNSFELPHSYNQSSEQQQKYAHNLYNQVPNQYSNLQAVTEMNCTSELPLSGNYGNEIISSVPRDCENFLSIPQSHFTAPRNPSNINGYVSKHPHSQPPRTNHVPLLNSQTLSNANCHFQSCSTVPSQLPPQIPACNQTNNRPITRIPQSSTGVINSNPAPNCVNSMQFGQFRFPPPSVPYFTQNFSNNPPQISSNHNHQHFVNSHDVQSIFPPCTLSAHPLEQHTTSQINSHILPNDTVASDIKVISEKERQLDIYLKKFCSKRKDKTSDIPIAEFRATLKIGLSLFKALKNNQQNLTTLLDSSQEEWSMEMKRVSELQNKLSEVCAVLSIPKNLTAIQKRMAIIKQKRRRKKKSKEAALCHKAQKEQNRERLRQEIAKWLDSLKEKNEKLKREVEMKKEADNILSEVRKKIHEAKKTIEKIKVFEKLRAARQANAMQKGLFIMPEHNEKFEEKISQLQLCMLEQLASYEMEERALRVMLETEQEGCLEEEALWRLKKMRGFQKKKQNTILECLFGKSVEPGSDDPLFLFFQYHNSGNKFIDNLVQIRHHWDVHLSEMGESIPQQWVVPVAPSSSSWEDVCS